MSTNWGLYEERIGILGNTLRDRNINKLKNDINNKITGSPSYQTVTFNSDTSTLNLIILESSTTSHDFYTKKIRSMPDETFNLGDIISWKSQNWLVTKINVDDTIDTSGEMQLCNYNLKFIDSDGHIASRHCVIGNSSGSVKENNYVKLPDGKYSIKLPFDIKTCEFDYTTRFLIDYGTSTPQAYIIENINRVTDNFGTDGGIIELTVGFNGLCVEDDNVVLGIANYFSRFVPTPVEPVGSYAEISYSGSPVLYVGSASKTFTPVFKTSDGELIDPIPTAVWTVVIDSAYSAYLVQTLSDNNIKLKVTDERAIGVPIILTLKDSANTMTASLTLEVLPLG